MKRLWVLVVMVGICLFVWGPAFAAEKGSDVKTLLEYRHDVTGDGTDEKIILYGIPFDDNAAFYKQVWAEIELKSGDKLRIDYEPGYEPKIDFVDLNHDGIDDLLYSSATGGSGGIYNFAWHSAAGGQIKELPLPEPMLIEGYFIDGFKAILKVPGIPKPITLDLSDRKKDYIASGLYQKNGKLNEPTELMIDPVALYDIIDFGKNKGYGLKSYQQISGAYHADRLGTVTAEWYYDKGTWTASNVKWNPAR